jgi:hypothetical protein
VTVTTIVRRSDDGGRYLAAVRRHLRRKSSWKMPREIPP